MNKSKWNTFRFSNVDYPLSFTSIVNEGNWIHNHKNRTVIAYTIIIIINWPNPFLFIKPEIEFKKKIKCICSNLYYMLSSVDRFGNMKWIENIFLFECFCYECWICLPNATELCVLKHTHSIDSNFSVSFFTLLFFSYSSSSSYSLTTFGLLQFFDKRREMSQLLFL